ncbi:MAG: hypothetical protein HKN74_10265 [Acidimicrobiia bacterium]|nr:hypothetical protein [Acidimicrobiia bacterium]MBT8217087.1 hypothetical protein [Acidimicrobiia bacterium]NNF10657.1 hypothetical protein [Acidimicrobiia bacterium]NNL70132.1 hypothetical protein [Acidimicrobiia bacterium]
MTPRTGDRRSRRVSVRYPERRTGFDRRAAGGALAAYRDRPSVIATVLVALLALNVADYVFTLAALGRGAREANPLMAALFEADPALAAIVKLAVVALVITAIWQLRRYRRILQVSLVAVTGFMILVIYQVLLLAG